MRLFFLLPAEGRAVKIKGVFGHVSWLKKRGDGDRGREGEGERRGEVERERWGERRIGIETETLTSNIYRKRKDKGIFLCLFDTS